MTYISDILFWISTGLLVPVIVLLILLFLRALLLVGGSFGQYLTYRKAEVQLRDSLNTLTAESISTLAERLPRNMGLATPYYADLLAAQNDEIRCERIISQFEIAADADLATPRTLAKMGPVLGLMGTLIPMGPALVGLSTGDIATMAYNMQVAFATTVVGLVVGSVGTLGLQFKKRWYAQDLSNLEYIAALLTAKNSDR